MRRIQEYDSRMTQLSNELERLSSGLRAKTDELSASENKAKILNQ
jgi:uncharacterized small protein (DUF1192 family)